MPQILSHDQPDFAARLDALLSPDRAGEADVEAAVAGIIADVRARGAEAVVELTRRFDGIALDPGGLAFTEAEIDAAAARVPEAERDALELAAGRIRAYHERQVPEDAEWRDGVGATLGWRWRAVEAAGLYVPGGLASYPSSLLMNAIPARVAGVERVVAAVPTPGGEVNPLVLLAARIAGIDTLYRVGGAQAIAAFAYGAGPIRPVDVIAGPGNAYVAEAKRQVFGRVGIDMIAGPSEILIIADGDNDPEWLAMDLMSQAEHDGRAQAILVTTDAALGRAVAEAVDRLLARLERRAIAGASWGDFGAVVTVPDLDAAAALADRIAPEHLELCVADPEGLAARIRNAGAIFLGRHTPEAIGDYVGGPNHVLPTARSARFSSGLSVLSFMKRTTLARLSAEGLAAVGPAAETLARAEGLEAHALSVRIRLDAAGGGA
ncbi:MAG TPA: histidinol dehydrogenase [Thermohalobaculum sp.]|nr:histidinol dehydrogenase [Thermohalobaculum sp.]